MNIQDTAQKIKTMEIRGAGKIARAAAAALKGLLLELQNSDIENALNRLETGKKVLKDTRPTAVSLENALTAVVSAAAKGTTVDEIKANGIEAAEAFIKNSENAVDRIAEFTAEKILDGFIILTHCNSSVVVKSIITAYDQVKSIRVFATETRPWGQGYITSQQLADAGVDVTLIVDSAAKFFMNQVDLVLFGADTITKDGSVINKIGTSQIAQIAYEEQVPVHICAESYKFSTSAQTGEEIIIEERDIGEIITPEKLKGVKIRNPVFDITKAKYIRSIITESGEISPNKTEKIIQKLLKKI